VRREERGVRSKVEIGDGGEGLSLSPLSFLLSGR